ncbi:MAG: peptide chain release factor N(5)-glutamine methyltransferase [Candidatus Omnitrophica bacterium CG_4_10_14_0_2_um_filter_44_9]|nr:MAG: peptide chain release factor N(5)-glutamine methyltransferase [Candidatus Omnitrophica bacterium CG_4_10_14_0_8_um_filter_44_12]PIZ84919.1 MAG: peptide chain release factor N(5)-glutamine methyltransferase [Candidatus Omnitrophica bacterium CG_4_10_14_0_2_um_filter_44_9]
MTEIEAIFCKLMKCGRSSLYLDRDNPPLAPGQYDRLTKILKHRAQGEPLQYLLGDTEFMGLRFKVRPGVLIPRPETEILVEEVLGFVSSSDIERPRILDIGTGSGNIAVSLAKFLKDADIHAADISDVCVSLAKTNARLNGVSSKIFFHSSDIFSCFKGQDIKFDIIVSNPPYISAKEYKRLPMDVLAEPSLALIAGKDGLKFYKAIEKDSRSYLKRGGVIFLEIGYGQAEDIKKIFSSIDEWQGVRFVKDLSGIGRVAIIGKKS